MFKPEQNDSGKYMRYKDYEELLARMGETVIMKRGGSVREIPIKR